MEATMDLLTLNELMHLTREELCKLSIWLEFNLARYEAGTPNRTRALQSLAYIRRVMVMRHLRF
jgi:hypothetical protein